MASPIVAGAIKALELVTQSNELHERLKSNTAVFRDGLEQLGFTLLPGEHPIVPIMLNDAALAIQFAEGFYVVAFSYPVVPKGKARVRTQMSAALSKEDIEFALQSFGRVKRQLKL